MTTRIDGHQLTVLQAIDVKGFSGTETLAEFTGVAQMEISAVLNDALANGWVSERQGRLAGWVLTTDGDLEVRRVRAAELGGNSARLEDLYDQFIGMNRTMKSMFTELQTRGRDAHTLRKIATLHVRVDSFCRRVTVILPRFGNYGTRLSAALARAQSGDLSAMTKPLANSYHDVWMELHRDLLLTLGRQRGEADGT